MKTIRTILLLTSSAGARGLLPAAFCSRHPACDTIIECRLAHRILTTDVTRHNDAFQLKIPKNIVGFSMNSVAPT